MSADSWTKCPKCRHEALRVQGKALKEANAAYGVKKMDVFLSIKKAAEVPIKLEDTLAGNHDIGISSTGQFKVIYEAHCQICDFKYKYSFQETVPI